MTAVWVCVWLLALSLAAGAGRAMGAAVARGAAQTTPAPDHRAPTAGDPQ